MRITGYRFTVRRPWKNWKVWTRKRSFLILRYLCRISTGRVAQWVQRLATGWTVRGSNPGGDETFRTCPDRPWGPPSLLYNGYRVFPGGKERPGRDAVPSPPPPSSAVAKKEWGYTFTPLVGRTAWTQPQCLYKGALCLFMQYFHNEK